MTPIEIQNLKCLHPYVNFLCFNRVDYKRICKNDKEIGYSPFGSDMMWDVVKRGCMGRFYCGDFFWTGHCFVENSVKPGHFKFLWSDPAHAIFGERKWSEDISFSDTKAVELAVQQNIKLQKMKVFW